MIIHNNASSSVSSESGEKYAHIKHCLQARTVQNQSKQICEWIFLACKRCLICAYFSPDSDHTTFSMEKALLLIKDSYFSQKQQFEVKNVLMLDLFQLLSSQDVNWWTGVVWITCDVFISCLDSHSDGTHSLQSIHCWDSDYVYMDISNLIIYLILNKTILWLRCLHELILE